MDALLKIKTELEKLDAESLNADMAMVLATIAQTEQLKRIADALEVKAPPFIPDYVLEAMEATMRLADDAYENANVYTDIVKDWLNDA